MKKLEDRQFQFHLWYVIAAILLLLLFQEWWHASQTTEVVSFTRFQQYLEEGRINRVVVGDQYIVGYFDEPVDGKVRVATPRLDPAVAERFARYGVEVTGTVQTTWIRELLSWVVPIVLFFAIWAFVFRRLVERQGMGGLMSIGRSKAKVYMEKNTGVTFADVADVEEAKQELQEIVEFLKNPQEYGRLGARIPKGVLLVGPPGTGKTLLARAIAGEAGVPFFSITGSEFVEMFVGVGAARVRDLFEQARKHAPCIIFIDELDALGRARIAGPALGGNEEREQTLNQLLAEMDGFDPRDGIVVLAATNRPEILDPALLRAGRFDRQVLVDKPDKRGRRQILELHARRIRLAPDVDLEKVAAMTTGFSGADLANLVNEAALLATRRRAEAVTMEDFTRALERIVAGLEKKSRVINPREREVVAYHEMGHALVAMALPGSEPVHKVSIVPRGIGALGYTIQRPTEDRYLMTREELLNKITVLLGGRAAEKLVFGHLSTGAADDLVKATDIARAMVTRYGMDERLGFVAYDVERAPFLQPAAGSLPTERRYSEETAREIDEAVRRLVHRAFERALAILEANRELLERSARRLLEKETLEEEELRELARGLVPAARIEAAAAAE